MDSDRNSSGAATTSSGTGSGGAAEANNGKRARPTTFKKGNPHAFKKGKSGNPKGGAIGPAKIAKDMFAKIGLETISLMKNGQPTGEVVTKAAAVVNVLYQKAVQGDVRAAQYVADRLWGKAHEHITVEPVMQRQFVIHRDRNVQADNCTGGGHGSGNGKLIASVV